MVLPANTIFRDFVTDGVPASGKWKPKKVEVRVWGTYLEQLANLAYTSNRVYATKAALALDLTADANAAALVVGDPTDGNDGLYRKIGATGTGSWVQVTDFVPGSQIVHAIDAGTGTPNAIVATSAIGISPSGSQVIRLDVGAANTGSPVTVSINGGSPLTIKSSANDDVPAGALVAGSYVGVITGSTFRLLNNFPLPFVSMTATGTPNAIAATSSVAVPTLPGAALMLLNVAAANTDAVTLSINGRPPKPLVTNSGAALAPGNLAAGMGVLLVDAGATYRILTDPISAGMIELARRWANEAEDVVVIGGQYSAYHWSRKALLSSTASAASAVLAGKWAEGTLPGGAGTKSAKEWALELAAMFAGGYTASTIPAGTATVIKALNTTTYPVAFRNDAGKEGFFKWDGTVAANTARADSAELTYLSPNLANPGAYVRVQLSVAERVALNRAVSERPFQAPPAVIDHLNSLMPPAPRYGRQINLNSKSEDLTHAHYAKDGVSVVAGDTMVWQGIQLQRLSGPTSFVHGIRDIRAADYPLTPGKLYIISAVVCAPFIEADADGLPGPWNRFLWMNSAANSSSFGSGAKLIGPTPRRIWNVVRALTTTTVQTIAGNDPAVALASQGGDSIRWGLHLYGLNGSLAGKDYYFGGLQIEEAPNQTEKAGIVTLGTSIDVGGGGAGKGAMWTQGRGWPRFFEGLLGAPIFCGSIGGQTSAQILARFDTDIAPMAINSKFIVLCHNVNDFSSGFDSTTYRSNWQQINDKAVAAGFDRVIHMTIQRRSSYDYANGSIDLAAENSYIKATYPFVIDRDDVMADVINGVLLNRVYDSGDGIHQSPTTGANRAFAFMLYHKYRHFFPFDNVPGPYQKTVNTNAQVQSFGGPSWLNRRWATRFDTAGAAAALRDIEAGTAPVLVFEGTAGSVKTFQLPCANYQRSTERVNTDIQAQTIVNLTADGQDIGIQYYQRDVSNTPVAVGSTFTVKPGESVTLMCDGVTAWRADRPAELTSSVVYDPPSLAAGAVSPVQSRTVTGAALGDRVDATFGLDLQGVELKAWVSAANTVQFQFRNPAGAAGAVDLASSTVRLWVRRG